MGPRAYAQETSVEHAESDGYWAERAQAYPAFEVDPGALRVAAANELSALGEWGPVLEWPHIPVSVANLPDGRILTWASNQVDAFPVGPEYTFAAAWDPKTGAFQLVPHTSHDMFCAHQVMLEDGRVFVNGGRNTVATTSYFDFETNTWTTVQPMNNGRWYPTTVALASGEVMTAVGSGGGANPEVWNEAGGWRKLTGVDLNGPILNYTGHYEQNWWPLLHVAPDGDVFHSGPTPEMHYINAAGTGSIRPAGVTLDAWYPKHGTTIMYDEGKLLVAGGAISGGNLASTNLAVTIDINGDTPNVKNIAPMAYARKFHSGMVLPNGEVFVVGGNTSGTKFSDDGTILTPEIWNPQTEAWRPVVDMAVPRNYHSFALLLPDARVLVGGGGLCGAGCAANHQDAQIYSPGYLFAADGSLAVRPSISSAPVSVRNGATFTVTASAGVASFSFIKMSSATHAVNSDVRFLNVAHTDLGGGNYQMTAHPNQNVLTPGYWMLFALDASGVPSEAAVIQVSTEGAPDVVNPGTQVSPVGQPVSLALDATDPDGDALTFVATGLPAGLSINGAGVITGTPPEGSEGVSEVTVSVSDAVGSVTISFDWVVTSGATGTILREWWTGITGTAITALTGNGNYPDNPAGSDFLPSFFAPSDWADNYGTRMRGYIYPPVTGDYTFWIASDDNGELWLSTDENPAGAALIATVPGWSTDTEWTKFPEQQSATIALVAGQRYYIEALQKEGAGLDNLAVAWQIPGGSVEVIQGAFLSPYLGEPLVENPGAMTHVEGAAIDLAIAASDPEGAALTYAAAGLPGGLAIGASTGVIAGTIADDEAGDHTVYVTVSDGEAETVVSFVWTVLDGGVLQPGVAYDYVEGTWDFLPDFDALHAVRTGRMTNFALSPREQNDFFGFRHRGYLQIETAGDYTFYTTSDDGSRLWIDGALVVDNDGLHGAAEKSGVVNLAAGFHPIEVTFFEKGGAESLVVQYAGPSLTKQPIPDAKLYLNALSNQAPTIAGVADQSGAEGEAVALALSATDPDGDPITFSAEGLPAGVTLNASTGQIGGGLVAGSAGATMVTVTASDGEAASSTTFTWTIDAARGTWIDFTDDSSIRLDITSVPATDSEEKDVAVGDLNKDGWDDIIVVRKAPFMETVAKTDLLLMNEAGTLVDRTTTYAPGFAARPTIARDALIEDLDGDGWDDVIIANTFGDQPVYYRNLGLDAAGNWLGLADESTLRLPTLNAGAIQYCGVAAGDINGDGAPDLYFANYVMDGTTQDVLLINDGAGHFADEGADRLGDLLNAAFGVQATIIDFDKDGDNDIVKLSAEHAAQPWGDDGIFILYNEGGGQFTNWSTIPSTLAYMYAIGDFDNNGGYDVYVVDDEADYVNLSTGVTVNAGASFSQTATPWARTAGHGANLRTGDLDGDGDLDIGVADVDTSFPPCAPGAGSLRSFVILENEDQASGRFIDPYGAATKPWNVNMFDFALVDVNNDGNLDIFSAQCSGYGLFVSTQDPVEPPTEPVAIALGNLNMGIAAHDTRTGGGYVMYSEESVHTRFAATPPSSGNADHLIAVVYEAGAWKADRNKYALVPFTPRGTDRLVAAVDFGANTVTHLVGVAEPIQGIEAGYASGDLVITPEIWDGQPNEGEFGVAGTQIVIAGAGGGNQAPVLASIPDQSHVVGADVSLALSATDADGDALTFSAIGLPPGLTLDASTGSIAGSVTTVGTFDVTVTVADPQGASDGDTFTWTVDAGDPTASVTLPLGSLNLGVAAQESARGVGYIMYSSESVHTRFAANAPSAWNADHLIAVKYFDGQWQYDNNKKYYPFTPAPDDRLLVEVQFETDVVTPLAGVNTIVSGIGSGYVSGDLTVTANEWGGVFNEGEFGIGGSFVEVPGSASSKQKGAFDLFASIAGDGSGLPEVYALGAIYPNPFRTIASIEYALPEASSIQLEVYGVSGQRVRTLIDGIRVPAGYWRLEWDGRDESGRALASGVYIIRFQAGGYVKTGKVVLVK
ncbi:MAG: putative Ig domain-containing protein [Rhodothermales bacterium]